MLKLIIEKLTKIFSKNKKSKNEALAIIKKCRNLSEYVNAVVFYADEFSMFFEKTFKYENNEKLYILFAYMYAKFSDDIEFDETELNYHNQIIFTILNRYGDGDEQWEKFLSDTKLIDKPFHGKEINKENALFLLSSKYANYLFPELEKHNTIPQSIAIMEFISPISTLANNQKHFYNMD